MAEHDQRAKYRLLPPPTDLAATTASVGEQADPVEDLGTWDPNHGAAPYLRTIWGPWVR